MFLEAAERPVCKDRWWKWNTAQTSDSRSTQDKLGATALVCVRDKITREKARGWIKTAFEGCEVKQMVHESEGGKKARMKALERSAGARFLETIDSAQVTGRLGFCVNDDPKNSSFIAAKQLVFIKISL